MKKVGLFLDEIKDQGIDVTQKFAKLGHNTGNMLFWYALKELLDVDVKPRWYINHSDELPLEEYQAFLTTDLVWIRQMQDFSYMNKVLDAIGILPLIPVSIGLQSKDYQVDFRFHPDTLKVLARISERCVMGVRGVYTAEILAKNGIKNFKIIGCPSMYLDVPGLYTVNNQKKPICKVSMNFETFYDRFSQEKRALLSYGMMHDYSFVEQAQRELSAQQEEDEGTLNQVKAWLSKRSNCFFEINDWRSYMRNYDFSFGMRFHGNVMALWENVPALFISNDSRTRELCEHFSLPMIELGAFNCERPVEYYYELADYSEFHKNYEKRRKEFVEFMEGNGICLKQERKENLKMLVYPDLKLEEKQKVLIAINHMAALYQAVVLKYYLYKEQEVTLLIRGNFCESEFVKNLVQKGIFKKTVPYEDYFVFSSFLGDRHISKSYRDEDWRSIVTDYFDAVMAEHEISIYDFSEIITTCDINNNFYLYCVFKEKPAIFMEMGEDQFKNQARYSGNRIEANGSLVLEELNRKYHALSGEGTVTTRRILMGSDCRKINEKDIQLDFLDLFYHMSQEEKRYVAACIPAGTMVEFKDLDLILLNSPMWRRPLIKLLPPFHYYLYLLIADYYCNGRKVAFKDHPYGGRGLLEKQLTEAEYILDKDIPIEFYGLLEGFHINRVFRIESTSGTKIRRFVDEEISLNRSYMASYRQIHKLYASYLIDAYLQIPSTRYHLYGIDREFVMMFHKYAFQPFLKDDPRGIDTRILKGNIFTVVGDVPTSEYDNIEYALNNADDNTRVVFLSDYLKEIKESVLLDYAIPIVIEKHKQKETVLCDTETEVIYFFCKNKEVRDNVKKLNYRKELPHTGISLHIFADTKGTILVELRMKKICEAAKAVSENTKAVDHLIHIILNEKRANQVDVKRVIIGGLGLYYSQYINCIRIQEGMGEIRVLGVTDFQKRYLYLDGYKFIPIDEVDPSKVDFIVITDEKNFKEYFRMMVGKGFCEDQIVQAKAFLLPEFRFSEYVKLVKSHVSIIANNCWGGYAYHRLGLSFRSPFINMSEDDMHYIKLLQNLKSNLSEKLTFRKFGYQARLKKNYPICTLGEDIILHFTHYSDMQEVEQKWYSRLERMNWDNLFIMMYTEKMEVARIFDALDYPKKICFVPFESNLNSAYTVRLAKEVEVPFWSVVNGIAEGIYQDYDLVRLLMTGKILSNRYYET